MVHSKRSILALFLLSVTIQQEAAAFAAPKAVLPRRATKLAFNKQRDSTESPSTTREGKPFWAARASSSSSSSGTTDRILDLRKFLQEDNTSARNGSIGSSNNDDSSNLLTNNWLQNASEVDWDKVTGPAAAALLLAVAGAMASTGSSGDLLAWGTQAFTGIESFLADPQSVLQNVVDSVQAMGPIGMFYFGAFYLVAEVLAVPATPLTMAAGSLFGLGPGVAVVLTAATLAASVAFVVGKTFLRSWVEEILEENETFRKLDVAVGEQGFKLLVLLRLSPLFPFALSNYLYGASSISFPAYFWGTLLGFAPGTIGYVYTGMVGKEILLGGDSSQPWYYYAAGFSVLLAFFKVITDVATEIVQAIEDEEDGQPTV